MHVLHHPGRSRVGSPRTRSTGIIEQVRRSVDHGMREIKLTGQDTAAYGLDAGTNLAALLRAVDGLAGKFRVRVAWRTP